MSSALVLAHCVCIFIASSGITCAYLQAVATGCKPPRWQYLAMLTGRLVYDIVASPHAVRTRTVLPLVLATESMLAVWCMRGQHPHVGDFTAMHRLPLLCLCADLMSAPVLLWLTPEAVCTP